MARRRRRATAPAPAPAPPRGLAVTWIRSAYSLLSERLTQLPRAAPAWLRRVAAALLRLLAGPAPAVAPMPPAGDAGEGVCAVGPDAERANNVRDEQPAGNAGEGGLPSGSDGESLGNVRGEQPAGDAGEGGLPSGSDIESLGNVRGKPAGDAGEGVCPAGPDAQTLSSVRGQQPAGDAGQRACPPNRQAQVPKKVRLCTYCKNEGHVAKDCRQPRIIPSRGQLEQRYQNNAENGDHHDSYKLDQFFAEEEENDPVINAHMTYLVEGSNCKKGFMLCLICHLEGRTGDKFVKNKDDKVKKHCWTKHRICGILCDKRGCLARVRTLQDLGLHQYLCHGI